MPDFITCTTAPDIICPPIFALRVSGWIGAQNIGDSMPGIATPPPEGIRLRWNCPFLGSDPAGRIGYPTRFRVLRTADVSGWNLIRRNPSAGHIPRTLAPQRLWHTVHLSGSEAYVGNNPCDRADAVYFELDVRAAPVEAVLVDTSGRHAITIELQPGNRFYYEMAALHGVVFSARPQLVGSIEFLDLRGTLRELDMEAKVIATVDARVWAHVPLAQASERFTNPADQAFVSLQAEDWDALAQRGATVMQGHDAGLPVPLSEIQVLEAAAAARWEAATLMGWGFLDGEHPAHPALDQIDPTAMMAPGTNGIFGYQILAEFDGGNSQPPIVRPSSLQFVSPTPEGMLTRANVRSLITPRATVEMTNLIAPGPAPDRPQVGGAPRELVYCRSSYLFATANLDNERVLVEPMASESTLSGEAFTPIGTFGQGASDPIVRVVGLERHLARNYDYKVPFFDSKVWLDVTIGDGWDRQFHQGPTAPIDLFPIDYGGTAPPLASAVCDSANGSIELILDPGPPWIADLLARLTGGRVQTMARNPMAIRLEVAVTAGAPFLAEGQTWGATISPAISAADRDKLVGGVFSADTFNALILGFSMTPTGQQFCEFQANAHCAGETLYPTMNAVCPAMLREAEASSRLWRMLGEIALISGGVPAANSQTAEIATFAHPTTSTTFWFSTRMAVDVTGRTYYGPLTTPVPAPYLHPAPKPPDLCLRVQQLGTDFYGRGVIKVSTEDCERFSPGLEITMVAVGLDIITVGDKGNVDGAPDTSQSRGMFRQQVAFQDHTVFEAFESLAQTPDGNTFKLGVAYVRASDDASSHPAPTTIIARATGD